MDRPGQGGASGIGRRRVLGITLAATLLMTGCSRSGKAGLSGTSLSGEIAPDFTLADQNETTVSLSGLRGKPVALSFIFTNCPDICPLIASQMRAAYDLLPKDVRDTAAFLGVTVDPERDTPEALRSFGTRYELDTVPGRHALWGSRPELEAVWASYGIDATEIAGEVDDHINSSGSVSRIRHTDAIYLIDRDGKQQALLRSSTDPTDLASDLKALASS